MKDVSLVGLRQPGGYDVDKASLQGSLACMDPSLTVQSQAEDADINTIVRRFGITGTTPQGMRVPSFGDFTGIGDYQSALEAVMQAEEEFMSLPADVRSRFNNNPQAFLEFCSAEEPNGKLSNLEELRKMGLALEVPKAEPEKVQKVEIVNKEVPK